jgi:hypothetical protein
VLHWFNFSIITVFIASFLPEFASIALTLQIKQKNIMQGSNEAMTYTGNLKKNSYFCNFRCKAEKYRHLCSNV